MAHAVLHTDQSAVAGYPYSFAAVTLGAAAVPALEISKSYRFQVRAQVPNDPNDLPLGDPPVEAPCAAAAAGGVDEAA